MPQPTAAVPGASCARHAPHRRFRGDWRSSKPKTVGYGIAGLVPNSLVCVPLFVDGNLIGVMEVVDKQSGADFDQDDVEVLDVLARQAAVAIEQSRVQQNLAALVGEIVTWFGSNLDESHRQTLRAASGPFTSGLEGDLSFRRALEMARLVREIASRGPDAAADCLRWLREYARETRDPLASDAVVAQHA